MRKAFLLLPIVILPVVLLLLVTAGAQSVSTYDVMAERVFQGTVDGPPYTTHGYLYFPLLREDGRIELEVGPEGFVRQRQLSLVPGDAVTVIGVPIVLNGRKIIVLREVRNKGHRFTVRDHDGNPLWDNELPVQVDPELKDSGDPVCN